MIPEIETDVNKDLILKHFNELLNSTPRLRQAESVEQVKKAFHFTYKAHKGVVRKSGEPYIIHPVEVAKIVASDIGLGTTGIIAALLHDVVEDTDYTVEEIKKLFGNKVAFIVDGLTKISGGAMLSQANRKFEDLFGTFSLEAENFKKILVTISQDIRVVLVKIADRLHNMRTLESMPKNSQLRSAAETLHVYAPLAYRLGLYQIKTELEDLSFKFRMPGSYQQLAKRVNGSQQERTNQIIRLSLPIQNKLLDKGIEYEIKGRPKSIYSIQRKMEEKKVSFEEVFDKLALRIVFTPRQNDNDKAECFEIWAIITSIYTPVPGRLRDWINHPKQNGYMALHGTVVTHKGQHLEVQIRSKQMDWIAENGIAAHWLYKGINSIPKDYDLFIAQVREELDQGGDLDGKEYVSWFRDMLAPVVRVFSPKGEMFVLPEGSTVLDFAFKIHTQIGLGAIGAKMDKRVVPINAKLVNGATVEVLTSHEGAIKEYIKDPGKNKDTLVRTMRSKQILKKHFKKLHILEGAELLKSIYKRKVGTREMEAKVKKLCNVYSLPREVLLERIGSGELSLEWVKKSLRARSSKKAEFWALKARENKNISVHEAIEKLEQGKKKNKKRIIKLEQFDESKISLATCCSPIPGDDVIGYERPDETIIIHKANCPNGIKLNSSYSEFVMKVEWVNYRRKAFLARLALEGTDRQGLVNKITDEISKNLNVNMRRIFFESTEGIFSGEIDVYIYDQKHLNDLLATLLEIAGVERVERVPLEQDTTAPPEKRGMPS